MNSKEKTDSTYFRFLPLLLIFLAVLSYGLVIRKLGIYWDDWAYLWTKMELGYAGIVRHFSFSRPLAGQIQNLVMEITGKNPLWIQIYGLSMRVICASLLGFCFIKSGRGSISRHQFAVCFFLSIPALLCNQLR